MLVENFITILFSFEHIRDADESCAAEMNKRLAGRTKSQFRKPASVHEDIQL